MFYHLYADIAIRGMEASSIGSALIKALNLR
jgi:hypothetical protein